jgi:hypothetical protein
MHGDGAVKLHTEPPMEASAALKLISKLSFNVEGRNWLIGEIRNRLRALKAVQYTPVISVSAANGLPVNAV